MLAFLDNSGPERKTFPVFLHCKKQRPRELKPLAQGYTAVKQLGENLNLSRGDQELNPNPLPTALPHCRIQVFLLLTTAHAGGVLTIPRPCPKCLPCGNPSRNNALSEGGLLSPIDRQHCQGEESNGLTWTKSPGQQWQSWNSSPAKPKVLCCLCSKEKDCCHPPFNLPSAQKVTQEDCRCCQTLAPAHHY